MALVDMFTLIITHDAVAAQLSATGSGELVAGDPYQVNFTYTKGDPPITGPFSANWSVPAGASTPASHFDPPASRFDDDIYGPSALGAGTMRGIMPSTPGRYSVKITVFQPDPS